MSTRLLVAASVVGAVLAGAFAVHWIAPPARATAAAPATSEARAPRVAPSPAEADAEAGTFAMTYTSDGLRLRGDVFKPRGAGPFPAIVYNHGSEQDPTVDVFKDIGAFFQRNGFVVLFPYRRGTTGSEGAYWRDRVDERPEAERAEATVKALETENADVLAAIRWAADQPYVDRARVAVAGCSFGGIETVLAAERSPDVYAAVDFAGASMSWAGSPPLRERLALSVRAARVPIFFLQAENDYDTTPSVALASEMSAAGKPHAMKIFRPFGATKRAGHGGFCTMGMVEWGDDVLAFLRAPRGDGVAR